MSALFLSANHFWIDFFWNFRLTPIVASSHPALLELTLLFSFVELSLLWDIQ